MSATKEYRVSSSFGIVLLLSALLCRGSTARSLMELDDARNTFPYWRCKDACSCSPYGLSSPTVSETATLGIKRTCFRVASVDCDQNQSCCAALLRSVNHLTLPIAKSCLTPAITQVLLNGQEWNNWNTRRYKTPSGNGYSLHVRDLKLNQTTFSGSEICVDAQDTCDFVAQCEDPELCKFSITSSAARFCPVCPIPHPSSESKQKPTASCELCEEVLVRSPLDTPIIDCKVIGEMMVNNLTSVVTDSRGTILEPFTYTCSDDLMHVKACGQIAASSEVEAAIQDFSPNLLYQIGFHIVLEDPADCSVIPKIVDVAVGGTCAVDISWPFISLPCGPI